MTQNYLRCLDYATVRKYWYFMIGHNITPILYSKYYQSINQDHDDHAPFTLAVFVTCHATTGPPGPVAATILGPPGLLAALQLVPPGQLTLPQLVPLCHKWSPIGFIIAYQNNSIYFNVIQL